MLKVSSVIRVRNELIRGRPQFTIISPSPLLDLDKRTYAKQDLVRFFLFD